ncbi:MAG: heavy-metal-associated domain-containing protein [Clostridiales bacterium]|nr:heavy-metal-associated domain-containing protein [Clostridiales bacterium]
MREVFNIEGMGCDRCVQAVTSALSELEGVEVVKVQIGSAEVEYSGEAGLKGQIREAIEGCGFDVV